MISVIICSINPELLSQVVKNIEDTIGIPHEKIVFDNREKNWGISRVYNDCARQAVFQYVCFVHEDIIIKTKNWGSILVEFAAQNPQCGVIGFAGGRMVPRNFVSWGRIHQCLKRQHLFQKYKDGSIHLIDINPANEEFSRTITIDGFFLFVSASIWHETKFDEKHFDEFHFYDSDFSLKVALKYQNQVCYLIDIQHNSIGSLNRSYCKAMGTFREKWKIFIPKSVNTLSNIKHLKEELNCANYAISLFKKNGFTSKEIYLMLKLPNSHTFLSLILIYRIFILACGFLKIKKFKFVL